MTICNAFKKRKISYLNFEGKITQKKITFTFSHKIKEKFKKSQKKVTEKSQKIIKKSQKKVKKSLKSLVKYFFE